MHRLFVAYKPTNISSNQFLSKLKRKYHVKKAGFSGTLDPFACGVLIVAFGKYTKLFRFLKKSPKTYQATLWLGTTSPTLDIEKVQKITPIKPISKTDIKNTLQSFKGEIEYFPPKYCAKKVDGKRAYTLARESLEVDLKKIKSTIFDIKLLHYSHPFITFEITISEGGYIRSIANLIATQLGYDGILSYLKRVKEGEFIYENEKALNPIEYLNIKENFYLKDPIDIILGKKLQLKEFKITKNGIYFINLDKMLSIIEIKDEKVSYLINGVTIC